MSCWLKRRSAFQYVLCIGGVTFPACLAVSAIVQAIWRSRFDISVILATSIGCTLGVSIVALWQRVNHSHSR
jgi:hypothetical protein